MSETFIWRDVDSNETTLKVKRDTQGRFAPPSRMVVDTAPMQSGSLMRSVRHESRRLILPILVQGSDPSDLRTKLRDLTYALDPARGAGTLTVITPDSTEREVACYLEDGMGLDESLNSTTGRNWQLASLQFFCEEPYWRDTSATSETIVYNTTTATFFPFFPLRLASSSVFGSTTINNTGDVETYPVWQITGPGSAVYLKNISTGKTLMLDVTLTAGESLSIDTTPGIRSITKNDGTNLFQYLSSDSTLWSLAKGSNSVQFEMSSADTTSTISYSFKRRWLSV